jgi:hypothetical protein
MRIRYGAQVVPGGALIASQSNIVEVYAHDGDVLLDGGVDTDAEGFWEYTWVPTGSAGAGWVLKPGPLYWIIEYLGKVRRGSTKAGGMLGSNSLLEFPELFLQLGEGVHLGAIAGDFAVTYDGAGLDVDIAAGYASVRGVGVENPSSRELTIAAAHATLPRIDTIVLELVRTAGDTEGKVTLKVVAGTAAASPVAPTLTQDTSTWQYPLADVRVNALATTVTSVTDRRTYPSTTLSRNPTLAPVLKTAPGTTALTTTPTSIAALEHSLTLVNNVWYEIFIMADVDVALSGASFNIACYIEGTSNTGTSVTATYNGAAWQTVSNAHARSVLGTGGAITAGVLVSELGGDAFYNAGITSVMAIPRS